MPKHKALKPIERKPNLPWRHPEWENLPRRRCDNCNALYKPGRPLRPGIDKYGFCKPNCKKEFHKHGGAYRKLRDEMRKMVEARFTELGGLQEIVREIVRSELEKREPALTAGVILYLEKHPGILRPEPSQIVR